LINNLLKLSLRSLAQYHLQRSSRINTVSHLIHFFWYNLLQFKSSNSYWLIHLNVIKIKKENWYIRWSYLFHIIFISTLFQWRTHPQIKEAQSEENGRFRNLNALIKLTERIIWLKSQLQKFIVTTQKLITWWWKNNRLC